ncbi:type III-B CRISPR module RAMP protein Cmr6 [Thermoanaerobacter sp. CM-CNRG TB177]|jgi:CRISPR-associated protein Cmr6|uniref:type III-B CRISPR module RAMP protein Cmr6 n=1 Tax=Thermoanaerobacter sp. CM-CNRG TB177 TaxID=2800659 RepID=UPI001BDDF2D7|nr:type III-B CRISPR module RAMP protein Cmr6 [Thermoanaerobacter sp. CM-CNRG TB177]MBT1279483.1 type III-B CRISPR module RAMP protein Cmr6 [Thermoanaerobacter sp. CM-CNRG TB177]
MINSNRLKIPFDTSYYLKNAMEKVENFNLLFNKYIEFNKKSEVEKKRIPEAKKEFFDSCIQFTRKQKYIIDKYKLQGYEVATYEFRPYDKIVVGLGQESVREVSMTLHWIYGIPYIPGQAIKGVISNWIKFRDKENSNDDNFKKIFGTEGEKGKVIFMDSYLVNDDFYLKQDIMNPHYFEYYSQSKNPSAPSDWQNPKPIFFLIVENAIFHISLIFLEKETKDLKIANKTMEEWMIEAFRYGGIGAKTSLGYGTGELTLIRENERNA